MRKVVWKGGDVEDWMSWVIALFQTEASKKGKVILLHPSENGVAKYLRLLWLCKGAII